MAVRPTTRPGRWAGALLAAFVLLFGLFQVLVASGQRGGETFLDNPLLSVTGTAMFASLLSAGGLAGFGVVRRGERSVVAFAALALGGLGAIFLAGELFFPH